MSLKLTPEEIKLMDELFLYLYENRGKSFSDGFLADEFKMSLTQFKFIHKNVCDYGQYGVEIMKCDWFDSGTAEIVSFDVYRCDKFINSGGFKTYFKEDVNDTEKWYTHIISQIKNNYITIIAGTVIGIGLLYFAYWFRLNDNRKETHPQETVDSSSFKNKSLMVDTILKINKDTITSKLPITGKPKSHKKTNP